MYSAVRKKGGGEDRRNWYGRSACLNHLQCFLSKPSEQLLADIPIPLILYLLLHQCRESVVTPYILAQVEDDLEFPIL